MPEIKYKDLMDQSQNKNNIVVIQPNGEITNTLQQGQEKKKDDLCSVCLIEFEMEDLVRKTICDHLFHKECLEQWLKKHENCPICRKNLSKKDLEDF